MVQSYLKMVREQSFSWLIVASATSAADTERTEEKHMISARHRVTAFINLVFIVMFPFKIKCCFQLVMNLGMKKARGDPWHGSRHDSFFTFLSAKMD